MSRERKPAQVIAHVCGFFSAFETFNCFQIVLRWNTKKKRSRMSHSRLQTKPNRRTLKSSTSRWMKKQARGRSRNIQFQRLRCSMEVRQDWLSENLECHKEKHFSLSVDIYNDNYQIFPDEPQITNESEDESAEEGEFTPSCWDQSLQPKRSSLKSPEKEKAVEEVSCAFTAIDDLIMDFLQQKKPRRVAFKIQRYHSVYEYPCEVVQLSPAYSEPQLWSNYMDDCSGNIDYFTYAHQLTDAASNFPQQIDGFNISSSSRPFHSNNQAQLHNTWPNDSTDFSWSQIQVCTRERIWTFIWLRLLFQGYHRCWGRHEAAPIPVEDWMAIEEKFRVWRRRFRWATGLRRRWIGECFQQCKKPLKV